MTYQASRLTAKMRQSTETVKLFYTDISKYLVSRKNGLTVSDVESIVETQSKRQVFYLPINADCEFQTWREEYSDLLTNCDLGSMTLTTQMKAIDLEEGQIFAHWDLVNTGKEFRHTPLKSQFALIDYLQSLGISASLKTADTNIERQYLRAINKKRAINIVIYAHFAVADFFRLFRGRFREDVLEMCRHKLDNCLITQKRRLKTEYHQKTKKQTLPREFIKPKWILEIEGLEYAVQITVVDSGALHGPVSLANLAQNTGTKLTAKDSLTKADKEHMLSTYLEKPEEFDIYSLGDLSVYSILENNADKFKTVYQALGIPHRAEIPKLTIGGTVATLFKNKSIELFSQALEKYGIEEKDLIDLVCSPNSANVLIERESTTGGLNAKVLGGRCYNPRPRDIKDSGIIADTDISGCYGEGMRNQPYPFGKPVIIEYPKRAKNNQYLTLREFLSEYRKELVPGLYQVWFSVTETLPSPQDFFNSYLPPKKWSEFQNETDYLDGGNWLELPDNTKIYSHHIENGLLTHDGLQWLEKVCSRDLKNFILDNSIVTTAMYYPKSERVNSPEELIQNIVRNKRKNTSEADIKRGKTEVINTDRDCKSWYAVNLGEFMVDTLLLERGRYKVATKLYSAIRRAKGEGLSDTEILDRFSDKFSQVLEVIEGLTKEQILEDALTSSKHPLDSLFKLCTNTLYGVTVSKYFPTSNTVVGNNITARARTLAWYMEKGLYTHNSITDGGAFNVNRVAYAKKGRKLNDRNSVLTNRMSNKELDKNHVYYAPVGGYDLIEWSGKGDSIRFVKGSEIKELEGPEAKEYIDTLIPEHLRRQFKGVDILHSESSTIKGQKRLGQFGFETKGLVKVSAYHGQSNYIFRGGFHELYKGDKEFIAMRSYKKNEGVVRDFLTQLIENPDHIKRQSPFEKTTIVKVGDYKQRYNSFYSNHSFIPGDSLKSCGLLREFSLSQFTFKNRQQREQWEKAITYLKEKYGQSLEMYFEDAEGYLHFSKMIETVDIAISEDAETFKHWIDKHRNASPKQHPSFAQYLELKKKLARYGIQNPDIESSSDDWEFEPIIYEEDDYCFDESIQATEEDLAELDNIDFGF